MRRIHCYQLELIVDTFRNFMRTLAIPEAIEPWSLTSRREKSIKTGAKVVGHRRYGNRHRWQRPHEHVGHNVRRKNDGRSAPFCARNRFFGTRWRPNHTARGAQKQGERQSTRRTHERSL